MFICPANIFNNVKGSFPIGFMIWDTNKKEKFKQITSDIYNKEGIFSGTKKNSAFIDNQYINDWIKPFRADKNSRLVIGKFPFKGNDFQNQSMIAIVNPENVYNVEAGQFLININNLVKASIYFAVRKVIPADWLNDRDQFLYPNKKWENDAEFQNDCIVYTLFNNNIQSKYGVNHWIPFTENEVNARDTFESHFMVSFLSGKIVKNGYTDLFDPDYLLDVKRQKQPNVSWQKGEVRKFSPEATAVFDAGRELWKYYHVQPKCNINVSLYDIRAHFQERSDKGKMNAKSTNETYNKLLDKLRSELKILAKKIEPKIYEYGFLK